MEELNCMPFIKITMLDLDLQSWAKQTPLTSLRDFREMRRELDQIQLQRWQHNRTA